MKLAQVQPDPDQLKTVLEIAFALCDLGRGGEAADIFRGVAALMPSSAVPLVGLARTYIQAGQYAAAQVACEDGLRAEPDSGYARVHRAEALLFQGARMEAESELEAVLEAEPDSPHGHTARALLDAAPVICRQA
ncbi:MAG: tetratricopeptide repeat protein [Blastocatellia bacterium]